MSISVTCPGCGRPLNVSDASAGTRGQCPHCGGTVQVPAARAIPVADEPPVVEAEVVDTIPLAPESPSACAPPSDTPDGPRQPCPLCGEMIPVNALKCRFCNEIFDPVLKKQEAAKGKRSFVGGEGEDMTAGDWVLAIVCSGIGCIMGIVWLITGKPKGKKMFLVSLCAAVFWAVVRFIIEAAAK